jgi:sugar phosphate isomerase/epimerase
MTNVKTTRRKFIADISIAAAGITAIPFLSPLSVSAKSKGELFFKISLAQWSLKTTFFGKNMMTGMAYFKNPPDPSQGTPLPGERDPLDFPVIARQDFGIEGVEYVNTFYMSRARDEAYLTELKKRCEDNGVRSVLIMCDAEGNLGDPDTEKRNQAVENHHKWIEAARFLGCHSIRVNARSQGTYEEQMKLAADGIRTLCEYGDKFEINVIVENHGGLSSNGKWLTSVMEMVNHPRCGILPDFGNFRVSREEEYDKYQGVKEFMPWAKGISAKSRNFDDQGNETETDFYKMLQIIKDAGFNGYIDVEYEGSKLTEYEGIIATKKLLEKAGAAVV